MTTYKFRKYTEEQLREVCITSFSYREVMLKLGLKYAGGNCSTIKKYVKILQIDISHFKHQAINKNKKFGPKRQIEDYLFNRVGIGSHKLKNRLIREGFFEHQC